MSSLEEYTLLFNKIVERRHSVNEDYTFFILGVCSCLCINIIRTVVYAQKYIDQIQHLG